MIDMPNTTRAAGATQERRTRLRLRELCDEVLASYRVARGQDLIPNADRELARALFPLG